MEYINAQFALPGFLAKNQPYLTKEGVVQCYKCKGMKCYGSAFKVKLVYGTGHENIHVYSYSKHFHNEPVKTQKGIPFKYKPKVEEY